MQTTPQASPASSGCPQRILVRGVNWLGDAAMTTPALQRLREANPEARIALLTHRKLADLYHRHPSLDEVITFEDADSVWAIGRRLRRYQFELGLALPNSPRSALELWLGGVPERVGYAARWRKWLLTRAVPPRPGAVPMRKRSVAEIEDLIRRPGEGRREPIPASAHHVHHYLHLVGALGANPAPLAPTLHVQPEEVQAARRRFELTEIPAEVPLLALNAGAEYGPAKRWPEERFVAAAVAIQQQSNGHWILLGGARDVPLAERIARQIQAAISPQSGPPPRAGMTHLAGKTSLRELCAVLKGCRLLLTNDTGPMHLAAAVGTPVVVPFGSTSMELTGPGLPGDSRHRLLAAEVPCAPCFLRECPIDFRCMHGISVERVVEAALDLLRPGNA